MPEFVEDDDDDDIKKKKSMLYVINVHFARRHLRSPYYAIYAVPLPEIEEEADHHHHHHLCLAPPSAPLPLGPPAVTLAPPHYPGKLGFGVLGSKIYVIGGQRGNQRPSRGVYIIDTTLIPQPLPDPPDQSPPFMTKGPRLTTPISSPIVVSLLGKLFAIPPFFNPQEEGWPVQYLPRSTSKRWKTVPDPNFKFPDSMRSSSCAVIGCTVIGYRIVVLISKHLVAELDGRYPAKGWEPSSEFTYFKRFLPCYVSQVVEDFWFPSIRVSQINEDDGCLLAADLLAQREPNPKLADMETIYQPLHGEIGGGLVDAKRAVVDIGEGLCVVMTIGFSDFGPGYVRKRGELRCAIDVVRLNLETMRKKKKRKKHSSSSSSSSSTSPPCTPARTLKCVILKSVNYVIGEFKHEGEGILCACLPVVGETTTTSSDAAAGYVAGNPLWLE